jgi:hypothetical protein
LFSNIEDYKVYGAIISGITCILIFPTTFVGNVFPTNWKFGNVND